MASHSPLGGTLDRAIALETGYTRAVTARNPGSLVIDQLDVALGHRPGNVPPALLLHRQG